MNASLIIAAVAVTALLRGASAPTDACALLTQAEVNAVVGPTLQAGDHPITGDRVCRWTEPGSEKAGPKRVVLTLISRAQFARGARQNRVTKPVSGIGDEAYYVPGWWEGLSARFALALYLVAESATGSTECRHLPTASLSPTAPHR